VSSARDGALALPGSFCFLSRRRRSLGGVFRLGLRPAGVAYARPPVRAMTVAAGCRLWGGWGSAAALWGFLPLVALPHAPLSPGASRGISSCVPRRHPPIAGPCLPASLGGYALHTLAPPRGYRQPPVRRRLGPVALVCFFLFFWALRLPCCACLAPGGFLLSRAQARRGARVCFGCGGRRMRFFWPLKGLYLR